jgi:hypothetical protein
LLTKKVNSLFLLNRNKKHSGGRFLCSGRIHPENFTQRWST